MELEAVDPMETLVRRANGRKVCWICLTIDGDSIEDTREWVSPCKCRDVTQWVHQVCLQKRASQLVEYMDVYPEGGLYCPHCDVNYIFVSDEENYFMKILTKFDESLDQICCYLSPGIMVSIFYWSAVSYGAITLIQIIGVQEAITMMKNKSVYKLLLMLPAVPLILVLSKLIDWDGTLLLFVKKCITQLPVLRTIMPSFGDEPFSISTSLVRFNTVIHPLNTLFLPTIAFAVGKLLFYNSSYSVFRKILLGGLAYTAVRGSLRIYQRFHNTLISRAKKIVDYPDSTDEESH